MPKLSKPPGADISVVGSLAHPCSTQREKGSMISRLLARWNDEARLYELRGQLGLVAFVESMSADAETFISELENEVLDLGQAATESGYSTDQLRRHIGQGKIRHSWYAVPGWQVSGSGEVENVAALFADAGVPSVAKAGA